MAKKTAIEQRLDDVCDRLDDGFTRLEKALLKHADDDKEEFKAHNDRIAKIEVSYASLVGKLAIIGTLAMASFAAAAKYLLP
jgi:hypothetical protein